MSWRERRLSNLATRFAKLPLMTRFHIAEELGTQLQPGRSPEECARRMIAPIIDTDQFQQLTELILQSAQDLS
jgi:hypothetical protein